LYQEAKRDVPKKKKKKKPRESISSYCFIMHVVISNIIVKHLFQILRSSSVKKLASYLLEVSEYLRIFRVYSLIKFIKLSVFSISYSILYFPYSIFFVSLFLILFGIRFLRFDSCTTPIQQLYNNSSHEGGLQYVGPTLM
jgi:hypothetical protein